MPANHRYGGTNPDELFWAKVDAQGVCWEWTGSVNWAGYGRTRRFNKLCSAHRVAWEILIGPIPKGLVIDHLCRNRKCVNPDHLEPVTQRVNTKRGGAGRHDRPDECPRGHKFTSQNTLTRKGGGRLCRVCNAARCKARRAIQ